MSLIESNEPADPPRPVPTLAIRAPGHAVMTHLLEELERTAIGSSSIPTELMSWHIGAVGEQIVGQELALLPEGWRVLHAIPAGSAGADIDHLVIGRGGVFVLNTKHHARRKVGVGTHVVWIDGHQSAGYQRELLNRCRQVDQALFIGGLHGRSATPVLVFVNCSRLNTSGEQAVASVTSHDLVRWLLAQPATLTDEQVDALAAAAAAPRTWGAADSVLDEPDPTQRFLALQPTVAAAPPRVLRTPNPRRRRTYRGPLPRRALAVVLGISLAVMVIPMALLMLLLALSASLLLFGGVR